MAWYCVILRMKIMTVPWKTSQKAWHFQTTKENRICILTRLLSMKKKLDFATAKEKAAEYVKNYPADEAGIRENNFLKTR